MEHALALSDDIFQIFQDLAELYSLSFTSTVEYHLLRGLLQLEAETATSNFLPLPGAILPRREITIRPELVRFITDKAEALAISPATLADNLALNGYNENRLREDLWIIRHDPQYALLSLSILKESTLADQEQTQGGENDTDTGGVGGVAPRRS